LKKNGELEAKRITRLENLGFEWDPFATAWERHFAGLVQYRNEYNNCNIPTGWAQNPQLANWTATQRRLKNQGKLEKERVMRLEALGFIWDQLSAAWESKFSELVHYKKVNGNCDVPTASLKNPQLGSWVSEQRKAKKNAKLSRDKVRRLEDLGFNWSAGKGHRSK